MHVNISLSASLHSELYSLARYKGVLSGDPIIVGHTETSRILGTFYVLLFLSVVVLMLLVWRQSVLSRHRSGVIRTLSR